MSIKNNCCVRSRRGLLHAGLATVLLNLGAGIGVRAQSTIEPPQAAVQALHIISGSAAGSTPDTVARRLADQLRGHYAQRAVVENRPGALGRIAMNSLKVAPADGSTVWLASGTIATVNPYVQPMLGYDPGVDLKPVSLVAQMPLALAVGPAVPDTVTSTRGLMDWMRRNPGSANVGSPGVGSMPHLLEALLFRQAGVEWQHVAFPGGAPTVVALLGGHIAALILPEAVLSQHRSTGRLRVLATSGPQRTPLMPDVPSLVEQGFADLVVQEWFAVFMLSTVPDAVVEAASRTIRAAVAQPQLAASFTDLGMEVVASTPAELAARINAEQRIWAPLIRANGIRSE